VTTVKVGCRGSTWFRQKETSPRLSLLKCLRRTVRSVAHFLLYVSE